MPEPNAAAIENAEENVPGPDTKQYDAEWDKLTGEEPAADPDPEPIAAHPDNADADPDPEPAAKEDEETPDEKILRLEGELADSNHKLSSEIGRSTGLQQKLQDARTVEPAPPAKVTEEALKDPEAWKLYEEDYPESAAAINSKINAVGADIRKTVREEINAVIQPLQQSDADRKKQSEVSSLEEVHPDWQTVASSTEFGSWLQKQPVSVQGLIKSSNADDAAFLLTTYKTATGSGPSAAAPSTGEDEEAKALAAKRKKQKADGATVQTNSRSARDPNDAKGDNYDAAWDAEVKKREALLRDQGRP